ncbi:DNA replication factor Dna2-domain-containing protein [Mucor mucedo]|uniref:DNA replication factor Dna2-domain-containing protein n=1 Tax=Mucor mucedo TaxID=29922 RepID=UPI00221F3ED0|nr:DNA replication factor Dna2-domain-containing protein [Mucor mucedo]KAI7896863.1 DNA replication factor Dna2-domain-containing protein [Mucor mucedo]
MFGDDIAFDDLEDISALATPFPEIKVENNNDLLQKELSNLPSPARNSTSIPKEKRSRFIRYMVASVAEGVYQENDDQHYEKNVFLIQEDKKQTTMARLRGDWTHTVICVGDVVHIPFISHTPEVIIDNAKHFIVVHPDRLISCTAVADSFVCTRKSVLQVKVRGISEYTEALVHGNIIHRVIQNALNVGDFKVESIKLEMERVVMDSLKDLYAMDQDEKTALLILNEYADGISKFGSTYVSNKPQPAARVNTDMGVDPSLMMGFETISISKVLDIEEHLWSPTFGIKGMVDASVEMTMSKNDRVIVVPFELKTGKTNKFLTNRAQTLLYTLLMADRYDVDVDAGLLYYSKTNSIYVIPSSHNDLRSLIISRNSLAVAFNNIKVIPPMIKNSHTCQYCFVNDACTIFHKAVERGTGSTSGLFKLFDKKTSHMTDATCKFVEHWWNLLDKEEVDIDYIRKDIWSQPADIREQLGRCLGDMSISLPGSQIDPDMNRWQYSFIRHHSNPNKQLLCNFSTGDPIVISSMEGHTNLAMGFVARISSEEITIDLTEPLRDPPHKTDGFHSTNRQHFNSFVQSLSNPSGFYSTEMKYRIDKDEMTIGMGMLRNNLIQLASLDKEGESKKARLRRLIIDLAKPEFNSDAVSLPSTPYMNPNQRTALKHVLQAEDYTLILGMPGTGKTTTTAEIIRQLVSMGKSVLVAAYTHTALDNVLQKVRDSGVDILRLGNAQKTFVLVGDLYQLPPIVRNQEACDGGLDKSLFSILAEARPESMCYLEFQYRMNSDIMYISNYFVYGGKLKCGNNETARRRLVLPQFEAGLEAIHKSQTQSCKGMSDCWLRTVLDPE